MFDFEVAFYLYKISRLLEIFENNKYKSSAYFKAAMAVDSYSEFITDTYQQGRLKSIEGIGDSSARIIKEVIETGRCLELERLELKYDICDYSLILVHGLSTKIIRKLFDHGIKTVSQLQVGISANELSDFGKSEKDSIINFLEIYNRVKGHYLFSYVHCLQNEILALLNSGENGCIAIAKKNEWNDKPTCISLICDSNFSTYVKDILSCSSRYYNITSESCAELKCITAFGIPVEIEFVNSLIENQGAQNVLRGDLHMHTKWSDGKHSVEEMAQFAAKLGREYIGISDHSYSLKVARGLSEVDAIQQIDEINALKVKGIKVLSSIEVEILKDGSLDFPDALLSKYDYVIAGIHTHLQQDSSEMQKRIEKALSNPYVNIFAHPTGKLLGRPGVMFSERTPFSVPFKNILDICVKNNVALELNCFPERFDIGVECFNDIIDSGAFISVGTDSHSAAHLNCLDYAEMMIAEYPKLKKNVINTFPVKKLKRFFDDKRKSSISEIELADSYVEKRDFSYFFGNNARIINGEDVVIGIDLTGSETKPSGWAALSGSYVHTKQVCTDEEIINECLKYHPKVVSIDSPLSYPEGRDCTDPNCECKKYGITRYCERLLSSFGIGVYPCLIPSMVNLTNRGISLAKKIRKLGIEVIESYPGVAQDILNIRRKQNGLEHLKNSYKSFGLIGDYLSNIKISHDELDAVSSALVGLFYINNQFVPLGNKNEGYLIVPNVSTPPIHPIVIGLTGQIATGKTTLSEYLRFKHGFKSLRYSQIIQRLYQCDDSRTTLQRIGYEISQDDEQQKRLSLEIIKEIEAHPNTNYVIDGLRHQIDLETLSEHFGDRFSLLYIEATFNNMFRRYSKRNATQISKEEFQAILENNAERDIISFMMYCYTRNNIITNNKTFTSYFETVELKLKELLCQ